ncbi:hypothetical protein [Aquimarina pacifica]|nr:hypothetical protein [Aquimarina pacifica]
MNNLEQLSSQEVRSINGGVIDDGNGGGCIPNPLEEIGKPTFDPYAY